MPARFGLQSWLGHKRIEETMRYVHVAHNHWRELPDAVKAAVGSEVDPDRRVVAMLGARGKSVATLSVADPRHPGVSQV